jgi:hypothetical protein
MGNSEQTMIEHIAIAGAIMLLSMVKKTTKPVFGQLTLTGELALDWVKNPTEIIASKIWFCNATSLTEWNVPEWALTKGIVALIFPVDEWGNPLFITQKSILRVLEAQCVAWEEKGAKCSLIGTKIQGQKSCIEFAEDYPTLKFSRPKNAKQYDPYQTEIIG